MNDQKKLITVGYRRWVMRQKSKFFKLLHVSAIASINCPYCQTEVAEGDFFCCSDLEQAWQATNSQPISEPLWLGQQ